jgi:hypothetical protein
MKSLNKTMVRQGVASVRSLQAKKPSPPERARLVRELAADFVAESQSLETNGVAMTRETVLATEPYKH